ncbi:LOW QUALITY PROTEIN: stonustoxin subunit alpha [Garra rufa]|uniref:LOW QUALITY PROTEIN: stonustoxin subunit alpha n=1 Tax=Garra rufa TaxID=137080 RepID=UPI003CCE8748
MLMPFRFSGCNLTNQSCKIVASVLQSSNSVLRELDLSNSDLQDSGVKLLSDGLKNPNCQLKILRFGFHLYVDSFINACDLTLDPNTANNQLILSENNRKIVCERSSAYPDHPERFADNPQVLCRESLSGRCYWEVEWGSKGVEQGSWARIAVAYEGISRKDGTVCKFGYNDKSWCLFCTSNGFVVWHNNKSTNIKTNAPQSNRVGVYVDVSAGSLSFYSVSDKNTHLHTFNTTFTEPLYAGFKVFESSLSLCQI